MRTKWSLFIMVLVIAAWSLVPAGCVTTGEAQASRALAITTRDQLAAAARVQQTNIDSLPLDDPARKPLTSKLAQTHAVIDTLSRGIAQIDGALADQPQPADSFVDTLALVLPGPWRAPLLLGGVGLGLLFRSRQLKDGITTIAQGIEIAKAQDPAFRDSFQRHANTFRSIQSPTARRLVDEITGRAVPTPQTALPAAPPPSAGPADTKMPSSGTSEKSATSYSQDS
jgi:hypothetical protein